MDGCLLLSKHGRMPRPFYAFKKFEGSKPQQTMRKFLSSTKFTNDLQDGKLKNIWIHMEKKGRNGRK